MKDSLKTLPTTAQRLALSIGRLFPARCAWVSAPLLALLLVGGQPLPAALVARRIVSENGEPVLCPSYLKVFNGKLYFRANNLPTGNNVELWEYDGTLARLAAELNPGPTGSDPSYLEVFNGRLYFSAVVGGSSRLWAYDPLTGPAVAPGGSSNPSLPQELFASGGNLYYRAARFGAPGNIGIELWRFDGQSQIPIDLFAGTGSSYPQHFVEYNGLLYFSGNGTPGQGSELWSCSGSAMPTEAARIYPNHGSSPENFAVYNGQLYFSADDGVHGRELWRYDGVTPSLAADIVTGGPYSSSNPNGLAVYGNKLYFSAIDNAHGYELWSFDGTNAQLVAEINPTPDPGNGDTFLMDSSPADLTVLNGVLYFTAIDGVHGRELWSYDCTNATLALDINPGPYGSEVSELTIYDNTLYFSADDGYVPGLNNLTPKGFALEKGDELLTLEQALDTTGIVWTTGSHPWLAQTTTTQDGVDSAQSGQVHNADDSSWLKATNLTGPGTVSFRWKANISGGAFANFRVAGGSGIWPQSIDLHETTDWRWETSFFGDGPGELLWVAYGNTDDPAQISLWVDQVIITGPGHEAAPFFTTSPSDITAPAGTNVIFNAVAAGYPIPQLHWRFNGVDIPNATNFTLSLEDVQATDAGVYSVVAQSERGAVTNEARLTVLACAPVILTQPADATATVGLAIELGIVAQGSAPLAYQWRFNGLPLAGETRANLRLESVMANQAGAYSVEVRNDLETVTSRDAALSVVRVAAWGENAFGQIEVRSNACDVVSIAAGSGHSLALKRDGSILAWGDTNWNGQAMIPLDATNVVRIAAGGWHSLAVRSNGTVVAWGFNSSGQTNVPPALSNVVSVAGGLRHSVALKASGEVVAWGYEPAAQSAVAASLHNVVSIAAGALHNVAILSDDTVFAWGDNSGTQCDVPAGLSNVVAVATGSAHTLALCRDGTIVAWGTNNFNQCTIPPEATNIVFIAAGDQHNLALRADGVLLAWGDNRYGQVNVPRALTGVIAVAGGRAHTLALLGAAPLIAPPNLSPTYSSTTGFTISFVTVRGRSYILETRLFSTGSDWTAVAVLFGDGALRSFADPAPASTQRFYRVRVTE